MGATPILFSKLNYKVKMIKSFSFVLGFLISAMFILFAGAVIFAYPLKWCWNYGVVGAIDGANPITFWDAIFIILVSRILFSQATNLQNNN